jgi:DNA-binding transcriptional MerR regulator
MLTPSGGKRGLQGLSFAEVLRFLRSAGFEISRDSLSRLCKEGLLDPVGQRSNYRIEERHIAIISDIAVLKQAGLSFSSIKRFLQLQGVLERRLFKRSTLRSKTKAFLSEAREVGLSREVTCYVAVGESHLEYLTGPQQQDYRRWRELSDEMSGGTDLRNAGEILDIAETQLLERQRACELWISRIQRIRERLRKPFNQPKLKGSSTYFTYDR